MKLASTVRCVDLGTNDECRSRGEYVVDLEVHQAFERFFAKSLYLACQLSVMIGNL